MCILFFGLAGVRLSGQNAVVGYYPTWKSTVLLPAALRVDRLTHLMVAFATPKTNGSLMLPENGFPFHQLVNASHVAGTRVLLSVGGAGSNAAFSAATLTPSLRASLVQQMVDFLITNSYDGIDIDWETPSNATETAQLTSLIRDMRARFSIVDPDWLLTMAIPPTDWGGQHFDLPALQPYVDLFHVMCYDFYGPWSGIAGHNAPLIPSGSDPLNAGSDSTSIQYIISRGVPPEQLTLGIPFYGVRFNARGLYQPTVSNEVAYWTQAEVESAKTSGWIDQWDAHARVPFLLSGDSTQFVTYEDSQSVAEKAAFARRQELGGVMIWELSQGLLHDGRQPLLEAISHAMQSPTGALDEGSGPANSGSMGISPNPFNGETTIHFTMDRGSNVVVSIHDILGRRMSVLLDEARPAGEHHLRFDASNPKWASGIYIVSVASAESFRSERMVLLK